MTRHQVYNTARYALIAIYTSVLSASPALAQSTGSPATPPGPNLSTLATLLNFTAKTLRLTAYGLGVAMIIYAGILYLTAYGDENKPAQAKNIIRGVAIGLAFVILAEIIVLALLKGVTPSATNQFTSIQAILQ